MKQRLCKTYDVLEGIRITEGGVVNMTTFIKLSPETIPLLVGDDKIYWLCK